MARSLLCFPTDRAAYGRLSQLISLGQRRAEKGHASSGSTTCSPTPKARSSWSCRRNGSTQDFELSSGSCGDACRPVLSGGAASLPRRRRRAHRGAGRARRRLPHAAGRHRRRALPHARAAAAAGRARPASASTRTIDEAGFRLEANAERHLKPPAEMARLFAPPSRGARAHARDRRTPAASRSTSCATSTRSTRRPRA